LAGNRTSGFVQVTLALPFSGKGLSFSALVKEYSGDIPARAMLLEMQRLRMVSADRAGRIKLVRPGLHIPKRALTKLRAMTPWIQFISSDLNRQLSGTAQYQLRLKFSSVRQSMAAMRELDKRTHALIRSAEELGARSSTRRNCELEVAIAFAASLNTPQQKSSKKAEGSTES
jgi:hypothetical protein